MATIGKFGTARPRVEDLDFEYFDIVVRVNPDASEAHVFKFMDEAQKINLESVESLPILANFMRGLIHPEDWDDFMSKALSERQKTEDLMQVVGGIMGALGEDRTQPSSDSSAGQPETVQSSTPVSSSQDIQRQFEAAGRPDLAEVVQMVRERAEGTKTG
jgi:hypothetical protein